MKLRRIVSALMAVSVLALALCSCGAAGLPTMDEVKGSNDGSVYTNSYTGLKFTVSGAWRFLTDDEVAQITGTTQDILDEAGNGTDVTSQAYDMMAMDDNTANNVNVMVQIVGDTGDADLDEILDQSESEILEMGASIGVSYSFSEHSEATLSGIEFKKLTASAEMNGISYVQGCYIALVDGVAINVTLTSYDGTPLEDIEAMFN